MLAVTVITFKPYGRLYIPYTSWNMIDKAVGLNICLLRVQAFDYKPMIGRHSSMVTVGLQIKDFANSPILMHLVLFIILRRT